MKKQTAKKKTAPKPTHILKGIVLGTKKTVTIAAKKITKKGVISLASMTAALPNRVTESAPKLSGSSQHDVDKIFNHGVLIDLKIGFWSAKVRNAAEDLGVDPSTLASMIVGLGTKRLCPKKVSDTWTTLAAKARYIIRRNAFAFPIADVSFVPLTTLPKVERLLLDLQLEFDKAAKFIVDNIEDVSEKWVQEQPVEHRARLRKLIPPKEMLRSRFYFTFSAFTVAVPKKVRVESAKRGRMEVEERMRVDAQERYRAQLEARVQQFVDDAVKTLRQKTIEMCLSIVAKIKTGEVVTTRSLNTLRTFIERFRELNFSGDDEIERRLDAIQRDVLGDREAEDFTPDAASGVQMRERLAVALDDVRQVAAAVSDRSTSGLTKRRLVIN